MLGNTALGCIQDKIEEIDEQTKTENHWMTAWYLGEC